MYIGAHGLYSSEVIQLRRKFGQWQEDGVAKESKNLEFYEYIEAVKLTGDHYVPAGQVILVYILSVPIKSILPIWTIVKVSLINTNAPFSFSFALVNIKIAQKATRDPES